MSAAAGERASVRRQGESRIGMRLARQLNRGVLYLIALVLVLIFMGPFLWTLGSSLKTVQEIATFPPTLFPNRLRLQNYADVFTMVPMWQFAWNTTQVTLLAVVGQVLSATLVAYGFSRFRFPMRDTLFTLLISTLILPREVLLIPTFLLYKVLGLLDTLTPLWLPSFFAGAFYVFLLRQFFLTLPHDLDEAAKIDGANELTILLRVIVPLSQPALATAAIFSFLTHWNDFLEPLIYLNNKQNFTLALGLRYFQTMPND